MKVRDGYGGIVILVSLLLCTFENCHLKTFFKLIKRMFLLWDTQLIPRQYTWMKSGKKPNKQKSQWVKKFAKLWYKWDVYYIFFEGNYLQLHSIVMVYLPHRARLKHCENTMEVLGSDNPSFQKALPLTGVWVMTLSNHLMSLWYSILFYQKEINNPHKIVRIK